MWLVDHPCPRAPRLPERCVARERPEPSVPRLMPTGSGRRLGGAQPASAALQRASEPAQEIPNLELTQFAPRTVGTGTRVVLYHTLPKSDGGSGSGRPISTALAPS